MKEIIKKLNINQITNMILLFIALTMPFAANAQKKGFEGTFGLSYVTYKYVEYIGLEYTLGYKFNQHLSIGTGFGVTKFDAEYIKTTYCIGMNIYDKIIENKYQVLYPLFFLRER